MMRVQPRGVYYDRFLDSWFQIRMWKTAKQRMAFYSLIVRINCSFIFIVEEDVWFKIEKSL